MKKIFLFLILIWTFVSRIYQISHFPVSLHSDEIALGYNAYSILKTGKDEFGRFLPVSFQSYGDWKAALPGYLAIPTIALFGLTPLGLRLPSVISAIFGVLVAFLLTSHLLEGHKEKSKIALLSALFLSISPWYFLHTRALLFEQYALLFLMCAIWFFWKARTKNIYYIFSAASFSLSMYAYHSSRIVVPFLILYLVITNRERWSRNYRDLLLFIVSGLIVLTPLVYQSIKTPDMIFGRAKNISVFKDKYVQLKIWEAETQDGPTFNSRITNFFHNKPYSYGKNFLNRFLSHIDGRFLFLVGDTAAPFQTGEMGGLYLVSFPLLLLGFYFFTRQKTKLTSLIVIWTTVSIIPAALTFLTPSSNRILLILYPIMFIEAVGMTVLLDKMHKKFVFIVLISGLYTISIGYFLFQYFHVIPQKYPLAWHQGYKELVELVSSINQDYKKIIVSDKLGVPYIYFLFYTAYDPVLYQQNKIVDYKTDNLGFIHVNNFGKYFFYRNFDWKREAASMNKSTLVIVTADEDHSDMQKYTVYDSNKRPLFKIFEF